MCAKNWKQTKWMNQLNERMNWLKRNWSIAWEWIHWSRSRAFSCVIVCIQNVSHICMHAYIAQSDEPNAINLNWICHSGLCVRETLWSIDRLTKTTTTINQKQSYPVKGLHHFKPLLYLAAYFHGWQNRLKFFKQQFVGVNEKNIRNQFNCVINNHLLYFTL